MLAILKIKKIKEVTPELYAQISEYGRKSIDLIADKIHILYQATRRLWAVFEEDKLMCIIGVFPTTMLGTGMVTYFFLGAKVDTKRLLRFLRRAVRHMTRYYPDITAQIDVDFVAADRFATYFGFKKIDHIYPANPVPYRNYMLRA